MVTFPSIATAVDKGKLGSSVVYLALLEIDILDPTTRDVSSTLRYVHNNENFTFQGDTYVAMPFEFSVSRSKGELPTVTLTVKDMTQSIQSYLQEYEGGIDFPVRLKVVSTADSAAAEVEEYFTIQAVRANSDSYSIEFDLGAENPLALRFPCRLQFRNRCFWRYKGTECGYTGGLTSCDFSYDGPNGCAAHNNGARFGGFPGIRRRGYA